MQLPIVADDMPTFTCRLVTRQNRWDIGKSRSGKGSRRKRIPCFGRGMRSLLGEDARCGRCWGKTRDVVAAGGSYGGHPASNTAWGPV
jgi:hypothetical protein